MDWLVFVIFYLYSHQFHLLKHFASSQETKVNYLELLRVDVFNFHTIPRRLEVRWTLRIICKDGAENRVGSAGRSG